MRQDYVEAPFNTGFEAAGDFRARKFTATETSKISVIPKQWHDKYVILQTPGDAQIHYGFSTKSDAAIDANVAATDAGAATGVGGIVPGGGLQEQCHIPKGPKDGGDLYFVREVASGGGDQVVIVRLADRPGP